MTPKHGFKLLWMTHHPNPHNLMTGGGFKNCCSGSTGQSLSAGARRQWQPLSWHSHTSCMKGWSGSKFSHPTDCRSGSGWNSWLDGVPFALLCHEFLLWSCTLRWRNNLLWEEDHPSCCTLLLKPPEQLAWTSLCELKAFFHQLSFSSRQCYTGDWKEKASTVAAAVNPLNYETSLSGKMYLFV